VANKPISKGVSRVFNQELKAAIMATAAELDLPKPKGGCWGPVTVRVKPELICGLKKLRMAR